MNIPILFENDDVVVVDKPYDLTVHPGSGVALEETLVGELLHFYADLPTSNGEDRPGIVHRLDKDTSGVMLVAKTEEALKFYLEQWKARKVEKGYLALISGLLNPKTGTIEAPVSRDMKHRQKMTAMQSGGKMAITHYEVMKYFPSPDCPATLVRVNIETGRTHQIRVHFKAIGFPVIGDSVYGDRHVNRVFADRFGLPRQFLHASELTFSLMGKRKKQKVVSAMPSDLASVLEKLA